MVTPAAKKSQVVPGDNIWVNVDVLITHDVCGPVAFGIFKREFNLKKITGNFPANASYNIQRFKGGDGGGEEARVGEGAVQLFQLQLDNVSKNPQACKNGGKSIQSWTITRLSDRTETIVTYLTRVVTWVRNSEIDSSVAKSDALAMKNHMPALILSYVI
ncbi:unnamed protein product [Eruca vesicaria subsp. sativa]|uniref:Uncharacterized protein n=1 Tax=Eruca vesicaria subsp. sativa TaxID=29727 RepID=A0ABC8JLT2_ERUVS|nr:unnamed protein product [Eruca vesicaria subsp. sativa]